MSQSPTAANAGKDAGVVLAVENLTTSFRTNQGWKKVVDNVSFAVGQRETLAIVGESGSGKSVTALSIMRLVNERQCRSEGRIILGGRDLTVLDPKAMQKVRGKEVAMIFQEPMTSLNPVITIGKQITESLVEHSGMSEGEARAETIRLLEKVRIPSAKSRFVEYPHQLSGGMRQRVMIARALSCKPSLLIADEPTTALDVTIQAQILALIKTLQDEEAMSVLFITHDMGVVAEIADRMVVMYKGEAVETGTTTDVFSTPSNAYTRALLSAVPKLGSLAAHQGPKRFDLIDPRTGTHVTAPDTIDTVSSSSAPVLLVKNLMTRFDIRSGILGGVTSRVHAVESVSFDIKRGETLALVGESGCGKSTTGRSILRLVDPHSGSVQLEGEEVLDLPRARQQTLRRSVQMIFQDPLASLNPRISIGRAIATPLLVHKVCGRAEVRKRVAGLLEKVGLEPEMASRFPHEFSGGQRQRICIARALALEPKLIVADESVSALDVSIKAQVINLLLDLQESLGLSYLFISHDMAVVERVSHRVAVMYLGEIVEIGPRASVFNNPQHPYTQRLIDAVPIPDPARRRAGRTISNEEIKSPVRPRGYEPPVRTYREVAPGHLVQNAD